MPQKIENNQIWQQNRVVQILAHGCFTKKIPAALLVAGPQGLGKTWTIRDAYQKSHNEEMLIPFSSGSPRGLLAELEENPDGFFHLDDFDRFFFDFDFIRLAKIILDSNRPKIIQHRVLGDNRIMPIEIDPGIVMTSNLDFENSGIWSKRMWTTGIMPLKDRLSMSLIQISFNPLDLLEYTIWLAPTILNENPQCHSLSRLQKREIMEHFQTHADSYPSWSPRMILNLGVARAGIVSDADWKFVRKHLLSRLMKEKEVEAETMARWQREAEEQDRKDLKRGTLPLAPLTPGGKSSMLTPGATPLGANDPNLKR